MKRKKRSREVMKIIKSLEDNKSRSEEYNGSLSRDGGGMWQAKD